LEYKPNTCDAWVSFAHLERDLGEYERSTAIFELAISQGLLDMPEVLWKAYIDFTIEQENYVLTRQLYNQLLERTVHVKVWISFALFEASIGNIEEARAVYARAYAELGKIEDETLRQSKKAERVALVESWRDWENTLGDEKFIRQVEAKMPKKIIKKRKLTTEEGDDAGWEEYYDYIFPGEEAAAASLKLLERARQWKQQAQSEDV